MNTLLLRLAAPLQSWGVDAKYENRRGTERLPTKSGVIGLVASALGRCRNENIDDLQALYFGVRVDREGEMLRDYHTAKSDKDAYVTNRYYLMDAVFLAGLEGDSKLLEEIDYALKHPVFPLFLGRRSCPPEGKLSLGIRKDISLLDALQNEPWQASDWMNRKAQSRDPLRIAVDAAKDTVGAYFQRDEPLSFDQSHRKYGFRSIFESYSYASCDKSSQNIILKVMTEHDPMVDIEEE
jgi:CRISPR system Cascade subunit CasD